MAQAVTGKAGRPVLASIAGSDAAKAGSIEIVGLHHRYGPGAPTVLTDVGLDIEPGQIVALLGPSGCGKTTLLRAIAGLERPSVGTISIDGTEVAGASNWVPAERRRVGMVFQDWALFPHMNVAANVGYGLDRVARRTGVSEGLEMVGLGGYEDRMPSTLSGGQQQRVALARALAPKPHVLLLDEPFSNLDTSMRVKVRSEVHRLLLDLGITAVFVTHDQEEAFVLGDKVAVMHDGRVIQVGAPHDLYVEPASRWVAEFVGDANLITGNATIDEVDTMLGRLPLSASMTGSVDVVIRPEELSLNCGSVPASVELIEYYGHDAMVTVVVDSHRLRVRTGPNPRVRRGDNVAVGYVGGSVRAFAHQP